MNDELHESLGTWPAPALPGRTARRIDALFDDRTLPGPLLAGRRRAALALPLAYAAAVATLVVITAPRPLPAVLSHDVRVTRGVVETPQAAASAPSTATAVSAIDLEGFEPVPRPRIRVNRVTR
jgi:hypothetical protein